MSEVDKEEVFDDLRNPDVVTKYRTAGDITNAAMKAVSALCVDGALVLNLCEAGDKFISEATDKIYKGKNISKGGAFPTCISVNNVVSHFCPMPDDAEVLKAGDVVKIDLGAQVDGYSAVAATTLVVGGKAEGKAGDLLAAVYTASEAAIRMLKIGNKNIPVTDMISKVADDFKVTPVRGVLSHSIQRNVVDGKKTIINKATGDEKVEEVEFEPNEVYAVDIVMSTGEGKPSAKDDRSTTVFKRVLEETYQLKMKASRGVLSDITKRYPTFPFCLRAMDAKTSRFGIKECVTHNLVRPYPVLYEKEGDLVAHAKFTCLLMPNGTIKVSGPTITPEQFTTELSVTDDELKALLATSATKKKKKNNKKKKKAPAAEKAE